MLSATAAARRPIWHNHFFFDQPKIYFMHISGVGDTRQLASAVRAVYHRVAQIRAAQPTPAATFTGDIPSPSSISPAPIEEIFGTKARSKDGMVKSRSVAAQ